MTKIENTSNQQEAKSNRPTHVAFWVRDGKEEKSFWIRCGAAWVHSDGKGFSIALDLQPLDGRIVIRPIPEQKN